MDKPIETTLPTLLSFKELCEYLGLGSTAVNSMLRKGELPYTRAKNRIRVYASDVKQYLDDRMVNKGGKHEQSTNL